MKILCFIDSIGSGGAQRQLIEIAKGFKAKNHNVSILVYHDYPFFLPELEKYNINYILIKENSFWKRFWKIRKVIREGQFDGVLSFLEGANFMATLAGFPTRQWTSIVGERSANPLILKSWKLQFFRWFHLFPDFIVANSSSNLDIVRKVNPLLSRKNMKVIYNCTPIQNNFTSNQIRKQFGKKIKIVVAASYRRVKNLEGLILAVSMLSKEDKDFLRIEWYGNKEITKSANYYFEMQNLIEREKLEKTIFLREAVDNIIHIYETADFVGLFSHYEGFPNSICEGMSIGKPVICSTVSDIPKLLKEDCNGFLCNPDDPNTIMVALTKTLASTNNERLRMGKTNLNLARDKFHPEKITKQYLELLSK